VYLINICNLTKQFNHTLLFKNLTFTIKKGEILGIVGQSGAGKTTLLKLLAGLTKPDKGDVIYLLKKALSIKLLRKERDFNRLFGFSTQESSFYENLTVKENLSFYASFYFSKVNEHYLHQLLEYFDLIYHKDTIAKHLSAGMQKRLDIICAIIHNPRLLFLDEPTAHSDAKTRNKIWRLIEHANSKGATIVITSHLIDELMKHTHRTLFIHKHKLIEHAK